VIVDSGTSGIGIPDSFYKKVMDAVEGNLRCDDYGVCDSENKDDYPDLLFEMGGVTFTLKPANYLVCERGQCLIRIQNTGDVFILGDVFIAAFYTIFDPKEKKVAFVCSGPCDHGVDAKSISSLKSQHNQHFMEMIRKSLATSGGLTVPGGYLFLAIGVVISLFLIQTAMLAKSDIEDDEDVSSVSETLLVKSDASYGSMRKDVESVPVKCDH
jgi:hypothetical protein